MSRLSAEARAMLRAHGITPAQWARRHGHLGGWAGDACGCPDDRCAGYHHDVDEPCGCLRALIDGFVHVRYGNGGTR